MEALLLLIASYGLCFGLMNDKAWAVTGVLRRFNFFDRMFQCPYCTGFHTGWIVYLLSRVPRGHWEDAVLEISNVFIFAFASSAFCYVVDTAAARLERE